ncbi:helix-turn-helix domain-containing protein [Heliobacterium mobile]|nr:helix-turn-helix domain-containing protein [Heliobacterium mobile]
MGNEKNAATASMITMEIDKRFDIIEKTWEEEIYFKFYKTAVTTGLIAQLGPERWTVLCIIASYMDLNGECFPSQDTIAKGMGCSRQTACKWVNSLLEFRWEGQPIIQRVKRQTPNSQATYSFYTILPVSQIVPPTYVKDPDTPATVFDTKYGTTISTGNNSNNGINSNTLPDVKKPDAPATEFDIKYGTSITTSNHCNKDLNSNTGIPEDEPMTAQGVIKYFCMRYREKYDANCNPNWPKDTKMVKQRLMGQYSPEQIRQIVDISVEMYEKWGTLSKFPRPSIAALCTWMPEKALAVAKERTARMNVPEHGGRTAEELLALLDRI